MSYKAYKAYALLSKNSQIFGGDRRLATCPKNCVYSFNIHTFIKELLSTRQYKRCQEDKGDPGTISVFKLLTRKEKAQGPWEQNR